MNVQKGISREQLWMISLEMETNEDSVMSILGITGLKKRLAKWKANYEDLKTSILRSLCVNQVYGSTIAA